MATSGGVVVFSCPINILVLTALIFMIEGYERVLPSKSVPILIAFLILPAGLYAFSGPLDVIHGA